MVCTTLPGSSGVSPYVLTIVTLSPQPGASDTTAGGETAVPSDGPDVSATPTQTTGSAQAAAIASTRAARDMV